MKIDWLIVATVAGPIVGVLLGVFVTRWMMRPRLVVYFGNSNAHTVRGSKDQQGNLIPDYTIHTHILIVRNMGRAVANNVRIGHLIWPDHYQIQPAVQHSVENLPQSNSKEIVIQKMVHREEVSISYMYYPPLTFHQIHSGVKSDEGQATGWSMSLQRVRPKWFDVQANIFYYIGVIVVLYIIAIRII